MSNDMKNTIIGALLGFVFFVCLAAKAPIVQDIIQMKSAQPSSQVIIHSGNDAMNSNVKKYKTRGYQVQQITACNPYSCDILFVKY